MGEENTGIQVYLAYIFSNAIFPDLDYRAVKISFLDE